MENQREKRVKSLFSCVILLSGNVGTAQYPCCQDEPNKTGRKWAKLPPTTSSTALHSSTKQQSYRQWHDKSQSRSMSSARLSIALLNMSKRHTSNRRCKSSSWKIGKASKKQGTSTKSPGNTTLPSLRPLRTSKLPKTVSRHLDREIKVEVRDSHSIQALRRLTEKDIKETIAQALTADPTTTNLASQVTAAK